MNLGSNDPNKTEIERIREAGYEARQRELDAIRAQNKKTEKEIEGIRRSRPHLPLSPLDEKIILGLAGACVIGGIAIAINNSNNREPTPPRKFDLYETTQRVAISFPHHPDTAFLDKGSCIASEQYSAIRNGKREVTVGIDGRRIFALVPKDALTLVPPDVNKGRCTTAFSLQDTTKYIVNGKTPLYESATGPLNRGFLPANSCIYIYNTDKEENGRRKFAFNNNVFPQSAYVEARHLKQAGATDCKNPVMPANVTFEMN